MTLSSTRFHRLHSPPATTRDPIGPRLASESRDAINETCLPPGETGVATAGLESLFAWPRRLARRDTLCRAGDPFSALHMVRAGSLKCIALVDDGREQITGYAMTGDIVGLEGLGLAIHSCDVVALEDSEVSTLPLMRLDEVTRDPAMLQAVFQRMAGDLHRSRNLTVVLGSMRAKERVAIFLLDLAERHRLRGYSATELVLRMTREEIASFLGLTLETVSRVFSRLQAEGLIQAQGRALRILDNARLHELGGYPRDSLVAADRQPLT